MKKSTMATTENLPPPPPSSTSRGSRKTLIAVIVIVVIVAVIVGVYFATRGGGGGPSPSTTPTPTSSAAATPTPTATASSSAGGNVAGASSLQYTVDVTGGSSAGTYKFMAKNIGTSNMMVRVEITSSSGNIIEIINGAQQKAWLYANGAWTDLSTSFSSEWSSWSSTLTGYKNNLASWPGYGDWTYTNPDGSTVRIHDITVNPSLADSLFSHS
jgi:hypothetical protein